jgi:aspartate aminotransferase/aminotransferase
LLEAKSVAAVPGITFGPQSDRYIRIAFTIGDGDLQKGIERLLDYMK